MCACWSRSPAAPLFGFGDPTTANGRTILSAGLTLGLLILPLIIINAREAIRAVPRSLREASYGLGATSWQTVWHHVLPNAMPGILTGVILSVSRAFGETAPLIVVGVSTFIVVDPDRPLLQVHDAAGADLPVDLTAAGTSSSTWRRRPSWCCLVLLVMINALAIWLRNRYSQRSTE